MSKRIEHPDLEKMDFHDRPVIQLEIDESNGIVKVVVEVCNEEEEREVTLVFRMVTDLVKEGAYLKGELEEIYSFEWDRKEKSYICCLTFLKGFAKPSFVIRFMCDEIELVG